MTESGGGMLARLRPVAAFPVVMIALLYIVLSYVYLAGFFFRGAFAPGPWPGVLASVAAGANMLVIYAVIIRYIEDRNCTELAIGRMPVELILGLLIGAGLYTACILVLMAFGAYRITGYNDPMLLVAGFAGPLATGVFEELVFRGGLFRLAEKYLGSWAGLLISSLCFGFLHMSNEGATLQGLVSISIWAGVLLAAVYMYTRRLWLGIGLHAAWNYTQGSVFSGIVSGNGAMNGFTSSTIAGPDWLTGGSFGVEASVVAGIICTAIGIVFLVAAARRGNFMRKGVWLTI